MEFEWDEEKSRSNIRKHGINFDEAALIFRGTLFTRIDDREDYGEVREVSTGMLETQAVVVLTHTDREGVTRIISARPATQKERRTFYGYCKTIFG